MYIQLGYPKEILLVHDYISRGKVGYVNFPKFLVPQQGAVCTNSVVTFCVIQGEATGTGYNRVQRGLPTRAVPNPNDPSYSHFHEVCVLIKYSFSHSQRMCRGPPSSKSA